MATANTTPSDVKRELGTTQLNDSDINGFISDAEVQYNSALGSKTVDQNDFDLVVRYLACHKIKRGPERQTESNDVAGVSYAGEHGSGLDSTTFGQDAQETDPKNVLGGEGNPAADIASPDAKGL